MNERNCETPLLSLCIPTFNRSNYLKKCIDAIICQEAFDKRIEIVISDNCSTDDTEIIGREYSQRFENIHYYRNENNCINENFFLVLKRASGIFRKLTNDTTIYKPGSLEKMIDIVVECRRDKPLVFFLPSGKYDGSIHTESFDEFIDIVGYNITWSPSVAIWYSDTHHLDILTQFASTRIPQVHFLLEIFKEKRKAVIVTDSIMETLVVEKKDLSYGLYKVFYENLIGCLRRYKEQGFISEKCLATVRKKLLLIFFIKWEIEIKTNPGKYICSDEKLHSLLRKAYHRDSYYFVYFFKRFYSISRTKVRNFFSHE